MLATCCARRGWQRAYLLEQPINVQATLAKSRVKRGSQIYPACLREWLASLDALFSAATNASIVNAHAQPRSLHQRKMHKLTKHTRKQSRTYLSPTQPNMNTRRSTRRAAKIKDNALQKNCCRILAGWQDSDKSHLAKNFSVCFCHEQPRLNGEVRSHWHSWNASIIITSYEECRAWNCRHDPEPDGHQASSCYKMTAHSGKISRQISWLFAQCASRGKVQTAAASQKQ